MEQTQSEEPTQGGESVALYEEAKQLIIKTPVEYVYAGEIVKRVDLLIKEIQATFHAMKQKAHAAHKEACDQENRHLQEPLEVKKFVRGMMVAWDQEQAKITRQREIELNRLARESETERQLQEALAAESAGEKEEAEAIIQEDIFVAPVILQKQTPKVQGVQFRTVWKWRLKKEGDISRVPREWLILDEAKIGALVRALKRSGEVIPGIESYSEKI